MEAFEETIIAAISWVRLCIEILGALVVVVGVIVAIIHAIHVSREAVAVDEAQPSHDFRHVRLVLSQYLAMALEFQLAADILATTIAPSWAEIGKLAAIATIRTALNYFLEREMRTMEEQGEQPPRRPWARDGLRETAGHQTLVEAGEVERDRTVV